MRRVGIVAARTVATRVPREAVPAFVVAKRPLPRWMSAEPAETEVPSDVPEKVVKLCDDLCSLNVIEMNQLVTLFKVQPTMNSVC